MLDQNRPHSVVTLRSNKGSTYCVSRPRTQGLTHGNFAAASGGESRGYGIPPIVVFWGCSDL
eukprot:5679121-Alexandrium_andersonii.AAC.1